MDEILNAPAFVIHLEKSLERKDFFTKNITEAGFTDMRIFKAVDGNNPIERNETYKLFNYPKIDVEISYGQIGCLLSHFKVLKHIIDNNINKATIFEDDVSFHPQWKTLCIEYLNETPKDFDVIFIGNGLDSCRNINNTPKITTESCFCTHAYIVTLEGAKKIFNSLLNYDYYNFEHSSRGKTLTGLYAIDIMLKDLEIRMLNNSIDKKFTWYCWNGTAYPCNSNKIPLQGNDVRNSGLVFQNTEIFKSLVSMNTKPDDFIFVDENNDLIDLTTYETTEQWIAETYIPSDATVLELGGRYGVVSVKINKKLNNTRRHFIVEPGINILPSLYSNLYRNNCLPEVFNGVISKTPLFFQEDGLSSRTRCEPCSSESIIVPNKTLSQIMDETGLKFDTLIADCEGCFEKFIDENIDYLDKFKLISFEEDFHQDCDYEKIKRILVEHKFVCIRPGGHSVWVRNVEVPQPSPIVSNNKKKFLWNKNSI